MPKIQKSGNRFHITLPMQYIKLLGWNKGTEIAVLPMGESILQLKKMPQREEPKPLP